MAKQNIDQLELKEKLLADEINWRDALAAITSSRTPPWKTKAWKVKRDALIANQCHQCATTEPPMVLQHTWQPKPISQLFKDIRNNHIDEWNDWIVKHPIKIDLSGITPNVNACPKCFSPTIRYRKTLKIWKCVAQEAGQFCRHIFETPTLIVSKAIVKDFQKLAWRTRQDEFDTVHNVGKRAVIESIDQHTRYLSMQDTITLCKRCACVADRTNMVLCELCKQNYHATKYDRCSKCAKITTKPHDDLFDRDYMFDDAWQQNW